MRNLSTTVWLTVVFDMAHPLQTAGEVEPSDHPPLERKTMIAITRRSSDPAIEDVRNRLYNNFIGSQTRTKGGTESLIVSQWTPSVDIIEDDKEYLIKAELPEVGKNDVKITVEKGVLTISGERKFEKEEKGKRYHRIECASGSFVRSFSLPDDADNGKVAAQFKDGVLRVQVAKSEKARPKQIEVTVGESA